MSNPTTGEARPLICPGGDPSTCIVVGGALFDVGVPVYKWFDPEGHDGYTEKRIVRKRYDERADRHTRRVISGRRYGKRRRGLKSIRQFLVHHTGGDGSGAGRVYNTLFNYRRLSVHFVVDDNGAVWQFLDVLEKAWHAGKHNEISVGVECNLYPLAEKSPDYYSPERNERTGNSPHEVDTYYVHGQRIRAFVMPPPQVDSAARIAAGTWAALYHQTGAPRFSVPPIFPRSTEGTEIAQTEVPDALHHTGLIGHYHATRRKIDPLGLDLDDFEGRARNYYEAATVRAACEPRSET
jgi:hypothetical protein